MPKGVNVRHLHAALQLSPVLSCFSGSLDPATSMGGQQLVVDVAVAVLPGGSVELRAMAQAASPASERDSPQSRALVVRCGHRAGEQPSAEALETLREWVLAHGCGGLEAGWRATTQTRRDHDGPSSGHVDRYYYSPSGE